MENLNKRRLIESLMNPDLDLTSEELDAELTRLGFDPTELGARFRAQAEEALGSSRRARARESLTRVKALLESFRSGLRGANLEAAIQDFRASLPADSKVWQMAAFRSLGAEGLPTDEQAILEDLLALAEVVRQEEADGGH